MQRNLSKDIKQKAFKILLAQDDNYVAKLEDWNKASDADLYSELVKGETGTFHTFKKVIQGRDVSALEAFWAAADVVDIGFTVATFGAGAIIGSSVKLGAKKVVKHELKTKAKKEIDSFLRKNLAAKSSKLLSNNKLLNSFAKSRFYSKMQTMVGQLVTTATAKNATFDIKPVLEFAFKKLNVSRTTIKRVGKSWGARLFVRRDAKVLIQVDYKKIITKGACLFILKRHTKEALNHD